MSRPLMPILFTNAPASWPKVRMQELPLERSLASESVQRLSFLDAVGRAFEGSEVRVLELDAVRLTSDGLVEVPLRVQTPEGEFDLFFYPEANPRSAAHFWALQELAGRSRGLRPVYYCFDNLLRIHPTVIGPVARRDMLHVQPIPKLPSGQYAMWWAAQTGENFRLTRTFELYERIYREAMGLEAEAFGLVLLELGLIGSLEDFTAIDPLDRLEIPLEGPEGIPILATFVGNRGVRFHFPVQSTSHEYRDLFLRLFLSRLQHWKAQNRDRTNAESEAYAWWKSLAGRLEASEQSIEAIGLLER